MSTYKGKKVEVGIGAKDTNPGFITRWSKQFEDALNRAQDKTKDTSKSLSSLDRLLAKLPSGALKAGTGIARGMGTAGRGVDGLLAKMKRLTSVATGVIGKLTSLKSLLLGYVGYRTAQGFLEVADNAQRMRVALDTLTGGRGEEWFQKINDWAFKMPLNTERATDAYIKLRAYGLEPTIAQMETLVDSTIGIGKGEETLDRVALALGQIQSRGKLAAGELNQLAEAGIPVREILAEAFGVTSSELEELMKKGVQAESALQAIFQGLEDRFGGSSSRVMKIFSGLWSSLVSYWTEFRRLVMDSGTLKYIESTMGRIVAKLDEMRASGEFGELANRVGQTITGVLKAAVSFGEKLTSNWDTLKAKWETVTTVGGKFLTSASSITGTVSNLLSTALTGWMALPPVVRELGIVGALIGGAKGKLILAALVGLGAVIDKAIAFGNDTQKTAATALAPTNEAINSRINYRPSTGSGGSLEALLNQNYQASLAVEHLESGREKVRERAAAQLDKFYGWLSQNIAPDSWLETAKSATQKGLVAVLTAATLTAGTGLSASGSVGELRKTIKPVLMGGAGGTDLSATLAKAQAEYLKLTGQSEKSEIVSFEKRLASYKKAKFDQTKIAEMQEKGVSAIRKKYSDQLINGLIEEVEAEDQADKKRLELARSVELEKAQLTGDTLRVQQVQLEEYTSSWMARGLEREDAERLAQLKLREMNKGTLEKMLDSWTDYGTQFTELGKNSLTNIQNAFGTFFSDLLNGGANAFETLWDAFKSIAINALSQVATIMLTTFSADTIKAILNSSGSDTSDSGFNLSSLLGGGSSSNLSSLFGGGGSSWMANPSDAADIMSSYLGVEGGNAGSLGGMFGQGGWAGTGLSGAGAAASGIGGALTGWQTAQMLYGNGTGAQIGGAVGGGAAGIAGAAIGFSVGGPAGAAIGAMLGGALGGAGGGGIGSLFDSDDTAEREADAKAYADAMGKLLDEDYLRRVSAGQESFDSMAYLEAQKRAHESDNRVGWDQLRSDYATLKAAGALDWWVPDVSRANALRDDAGYSDQEFLMRDTLAGLLGSAFADSAGAGYGLKDALSGLSTDQVEALGSSLSTLETGVATFGVSLNDLFSGITSADLASGQWAEILRNQLAPAQLMSRMEDELRANGLSNLEIAQQKVTTIIDTLLGSFDMSEESQAGWVEQLLSATSNQADLAAKTEEYSNIVTQLQSAHELDEGTLNSLITRGRDLRKELGLGESAFSGVETAMETMTKTLKEEVTPALVGMVDELKGALDDSGDSDSEADKNHVGGLIGRMHGGGSVLDTALRRHLITPSGGYMHGGGTTLGQALASDEVLRILQLGEYVTKRNSVTPETLPILEAMNRTGKPVAAPVPVAVNEGPASGGQALTVHVQVSITIQGDVIGDAGAVESMTKAAAEGAKAGVLDALANGEELPTAGPVQLEVDI